MSADTFSPKAARDFYIDAPIRPHQSEDGFDLTKRERTSLFPWRGQFSPDLVRMLVAEHPGGGAVVDPFMGSGTVLFEANRVGRESAGTEINPGAYLFAVLAEFAAKPVAEKRHEAKDLLARLPDGLPGYLFSADTIQTIARNADQLRLLEASYILACANKSSATNAAFVKACLAVTDRLMDGFSQSRTTAIPDDARFLPFDNEAFDLAITSPPYINVFNYHQQFRPAVEQLGYAPLRIATSEIGANRKHRSNRLLTVIQYCLDMSMALDELARVIAPGGQAVLVVGRESKVRKVGFDNGALIGSLLHERIDLRLSSRSERRFTSRFGEDIFEDLIFISRSKSEPIQADLDLARSIGVLALELAREGRSFDAPLTIDFEAAISGAPSVEPSPRVDVELAGLRNSAATLHGT